MSAKRAKSCLPAALVSPVDGNGNEKKGASSKRSGAAMQLELPEANVEGTLMDDASRSMQPSIEASLDEAEPEDSDLANLENNDDQDGDAMQGAASERDAVAYYLRMIGQFPLLKNKETEWELALQAKQAGPTGERAREVFVNANLRLVVSIARKYLWSGIELLDLIQAGNIGLLKALDKFNPERKLKFSTYATWWIRQSVTRYIDDCGRLIRVPVHMQALVNKMRRAQNRGLDSSPTVGAVANELGINEAKAKKVMAAALLEPVSLETPVLGDGSVTLGDAISNRSLCSGDEAAVTNELQERVGQALSILSAEQRKVIVLRFGLNGNQEHTLEQIARRMHCTREWVRQLQNQAIARIREEESELLELLK